MGYYEYDTDYYEPSEVEELFDEFKERLKSMASEDLKNELDRLRKENIDLREKNRKYVERERAISAKEYELSCKAENLKREVEEEFYDKTLIEVFEDYSSKEQVWYAEHIPHDRPKCDLCNDERYIFATYPDGTIDKKRCKCADKDYWYEPRISENQYLDFHKTYKAESSYPYKKRWYMKTYYQPNIDFADAYDHYMEFHIEKTFDKFDDEAIKYHNDKRYGYKVGFLNQEACQEYCDWLNEERDKKDV